jgi:hypothetical protein
MIIHEALGNKRAILLAHHGQLVATMTIEEAAVLAVHRAHADARVISAGSSDRSGLRARRARPSARAARRRRDGSFFCAASAHGGDRRCGGVDRRS